ncbi:MAG3720 family protein [Mycoplasma simbae]|uniref:MAG3720 family protein n=1 Tax=Mycoplasma simbae TaxID=36744 RepID=UPI000497A9A5|nr:hypothetical protein [Mycoplasma simbae]
MKNFVVNYYITKAKFEANIVYINNATFSTIFSTSVDANKFAALNELIDQTKSFVKKHLNNKKYTLQNALIFDDELLQHHILRNSWELKVNGQVNALHQQAFEQYLNSSKQNKDFFTLNQQAYMYECLNESQIKRYSVFPIGKNASKITFYHSLTIVSKQDALYTNVINLFNAKNVNLDKVMLSSTCLNATQNKDAHNVLVQIDFNKIAINGFFNNVPLYSEIKTLKFDSFFNKIAQKYAISTELTHAYVNAVIANWRYHIANLNANTKETIIFMALSQTLKNILQLVQASHQNNYESNQQIEYVIKGFDAEFVEYLLATNTNLQLSTFSANQHNEQILKAQFLGSAILVSGTKGVDLVQTLNDIDNLKPKTFMQKVLTMFKNENA